VAQYDGEINYMDEHLQRLFDAMKRLGLWDRSLIIVLSDHGEILDDHVGHFDHQGLYEGDIRVPLIMRFPDGQYGGTRIEALTANVDVAPTIMEFLGLPAPRQMEGRSLMPLIRGEAGEHRDQLFLGESNWQCKRGVRTKEWKFIRALSTAAKHNWHGQGRRELYNLVADPLEQNNVVHVRPRVARELERRLDEYLARCRERYGHEDPIRIQGTTFGIRHLTQCKTADFASDEPIR
jgi:arylsulfatase A-like enzyme